MTPRLVAGITLAIASRAEPMVLPVAPVALGVSWLLIDWDAIRLPTGITAPR